MPYKNKEDLKKRHHEYYLKNKDKISEKGRKYYINNKEKMNEINRLNHLKNKDRDTAAALKHRDKKIKWFWSEVGSYCRRCGYHKSIAALQFHHLEPSQKENVKDTLSNWLRKNSFNILKKKVSEHKFLILCANCHAEYHAGEWK